MSDTVQYSSELCKTKTSQCIQQRRLWGSFSHCHNEVKSVQMLSYHRIRQSQRCVLTPSFAADRLKWCLQKCVCSPRGQQVHIMPPRALLIIRYLSQKLLYVCWYPAFTCSKNCHAPAMCVWVLNGPVALYVRNYFICLTQFGWMVHYNPIKQSLRGKRVPDTFTVTHYLFVCAPGSCFLCCRDQDSELLKIVRLSVF